MPVEIPEALAANCQKTIERMAWLKSLPLTIERLECEWSIKLGTPFDSQAGWVAPATQASGIRAVLKLGMPHMEGQDEVRGMLFWNGEPTAQVLKADQQVSAMLLERCEPGVTLRAEREEKQDIVIAGLLRRLWRPPAAPTSFRPLSAMTRFWSEETRADVEMWPEAGLVREGLRLFEELPRTTSTEVLLATDLHAGNILSAAREPWLVIDPKPFVGDPAYDATQHLFNCRERMLSDWQGTIRRVANLMEVSEERIRLWMFARLAAEPRDDWNDQAHLTLARKLSM